ncbi:MAG: Hpt domain-containing protein, partial [Planctomycetes bacterium]|nr:Hpt domain-containing protein [Planctomycetota bacterium]
MSGDPANLDLVADYLGEAHDYLDTLNRILLELSDKKGGWPSETVNELFRCAHSLKGLSACFGFDRSNKVTHELESLLVLVRDGKIAPDTKVVRALFGAIDLVTHLTGEIAAGCRETADIELVLNDLRQAEVSGAPAAGDAPESQVQDAGSGREPKRPEPVVAVAAGKPGANETVRVRMDRLDRMVNLTGELVIARSRFQIVTNHLRSLHHLGELVSAARELREDIEHAVGKGEPRTAERLVGILERLRVRAETLTDGMSEFGDLGRSLRDLEEAAYDLDGITSGIHEAVLQLRMVPLDTVFRRLQRTVHDTAELLGKRIDLDLDGGETQIDKRMADELVNPMVHILRNAADHGIESMSARMAAGKSGRGLIRVASRQQGSSVVIEIEDDGAGIDPERVADKAIEKGIVTAEAVAAMSTDQVRRLVLAPGFSTAAAVTDISGRGMGMDIVESTIKRLRGSLDLTSEVGRGTRFTITLPPSMSILSSLLIEVRGTTFALPMTEVREIIELTRMRIH